MIAISRALARRFRAVLRRSLVDQEPRGSWPLVLCRVGKDGLTLQACQGDLAVRYHIDGLGEPEAMAFRASMLAEFEGRSDDPVELEQIAFGKGQARWSEAGVPRAKDLETVEPDSAPEFPSVPRQWTPMPAGFIEVLDRAVQTTARDPVRHALTRVQLRGKTGEIIATDGRQLLVQGGFNLPWRETLLVPRIPAFGARERIDEGQVAVGRTKSHVAIRIGPWTFLLRIDTLARFPNVDTVIPKATRRSTRLHIDPEDAALLVASLPSLPGNKDEGPVITLDLHLPVTLRGRDEKQGVTELVFTRSTVSGPPVRVCTDRCYLLRAIKLGFTDVAVPGVDKPLVCRDAARVYVWVPHHGSEAILQKPDMKPISSAEDPPPSPSPESERSNTMPAPRVNGDSPDTRHRNGSSEPERWGIAEVIAETEALRDVLHDAAGRTARLLAALKHQRRRSRAVQQAMRSLKELQLDH